jgi:hypothetical protein
MDEPIDVSASVDAFWRWFSSNSQRLLDATDPEGPDFDEVQEKLDEITEGLSFSFSMHKPDQREVVISANGDVELFDLVDFMIDRMPELPSWEGVALNPALGPTFKTMYEGRTFDASQALFAPVTDDDDPEYLGLLVAVPGIGPEDIEDDAVKNGVTMMLFTMLGERIAAMMIHAVEVIPFPSGNPVEEELEPLPELVGFLADRMAMLSDMYESGELGNDEDEDGDEDEDDDQDDQDNEDDDDQDDDRDEDEDRDEDRNQKDNPPRGGPSPKNSGPSSHSPRR